MSDRTDGDRLAGVRMDDEEIDAFLRERGAGVLALADGGEAYAVPLSYGYRGGSLYFAYFRFSEEPTKEAYTEATDRACFTVYEAETAYEWRSVMARGPIRSVDPDRWDEVGAAMDASAWSPDLSTVGPRRPSVGTYALDVEEATGFKGREYA